VRAVPCRCELYPGICLKTEEKTRENLSQGSRRVPEGTMETILDGDLVCTFKISVTDTPVTKCKNPEDLNHQRCRHLACGTEHSSTLHYHSNPWPHSKGGFILYNWQNADRLTQSFTDWSTNKLTSDWQLDLLTSMTDWPTYRLNKMSLTDWPSDHWLTEISDCSDDVLTKWFHWLINWRYRFTDQPAPPKSVNDWFTKWHHWKVSVNF